MSLFDDKFKYTKEANDFQNEIHDLVKTSIHRMILDGHSPRELEYLGQAAVQEVVLNAMLFPKYAIGYDPDYGDDIVCVCEHTYYRHFDLHDGDNVHCSCKYCDCGTFIPDKNQPKPIQFSWAGHSYEMKASAFPVVAYVELPTPEPIFLNFEFGENREDPINHTFKVVSLDEVVGSRLTTCREV